MYAKVEKPKENKSRAVANSVAQRNNDKQAFQFVDNRLEATAQRRLQEIANHSSETTQEKSLGIQRGTTEQLTGKGMTPKTQHHPTGSTIQLIANVFLETDENDKKSLLATGTVKDFKGGSSAGTKGWVNVTKYRSWYTIDSKDGAFQDKGNVGPFQNDYTNPEAGHILAKQNGGNGGDPDNIFAQDGGTNNGKYKSFEIDMRKALNLYDNKDTVKFKSYLSGDDIKEGTIADAGLSEASSIESD